MSCRCHEEKTAETIVQKIFDELPVTVKTNDQLRMRNKQVEIRAKGKCAHSNVHWVWNFRFASCAVPDADNGNDFLSRRKFANDAIRAKNNFTNRFIIFLRHDAANLRKLCEHVHLGHQPVTERFRDGGIILGDKQDDGLLVVACLLRPDYLESHVANCRLTSSWGMVWPRSIWPSPLRTAARNSTRSAMTSRLASSGKLLMDSRASCLSPMARKMASSAATRKREAEQKATETIVQKIFDELPVP